MMTITAIGCLAIACSPSRDGGTPIGQGGEGGRGGGSRGAGGNGGSAGGIIVRQPDGWDRDVAIRQPVDLNPDPHILEVNIEATVVAQTILPGTTTPVWTYNGQIPGPLLRAHTGDRVIVHFTNHLPEATTIHWHGIRLSADMDGTPSAQPPVEPNGTFDYSFVVPDAGLFWYHPHLHTNVQVADGLYGALYVEDAPPVRDFGDEVTLVLSDMQVNADGSLPAPNLMDGAISIWGREGDIVWVNGKVTPTILARRGQRQRWHLVNAAGSRYFNMDFAGHHFTRIGGDGGLREAPVESETLLLVPGERADVLVTPDATVGTTLAVRWLPYDRGFGTALDRVPSDILYVKIAEDVSGPVPPSLPTTLRTIPAVDVEGARSQRVFLALVGAGYGVNGENFGGGEEGALHGIVGQTDVWTIKNDSPFDHPFHIHGFFFQVLDSDTSQPVSPREWKDTVNIPQNKTLKLAVNYDDRPGMWMFHCHILDHAEIGLMGMLHVAR